MVVFVRSLAAIAAGLIVLSAIAEGIEFAIVTALHGAVTQDQAVYLGIRNQTPVLLAKLIYNTAAAGAAGYVTALVAGRRELLHGTILALIQLSLFAWAMLFSEFAGTTPTWNWLILMPLMGGGILLGARRRSKRTCSANVDLPQREPS
jgi:hypothetical protein